jgi:hypothetical protein
VDEEEREIFERLQEGPYRDKFEFHRHAAIRPIDLQRLLMTYEPHIVHFSGHGSKQHKMILGGKPGRGKQVDRDGLVRMFALYKSHVQLVVLNACFTRTQALSLSEVIDYSVGAGQGIGDKEGVAFAGAFYRALGFGRSVKAAFESARVELDLVKMPRTKGLGLFIRNGVNEDDRFPNGVRDFSRDSVDAGRRVPDLFSSHLGDTHILQRAGALLQDQRTKRTENRSPVLDSAAIGPSNLIYEEAYQNSEHTWAEVSSVQTETSAMLGLMRASDKRSRSSLARLRKVNGANRAKSNAVKDEIEARTSIKYTRAYGAVTIKIQRVTRSLSTVVRKTHSAPKDQVRHTRASFATKRRDRGRRLDSDSSD